MKKKNRLLIAISAIALTAFVMFNASTILNNNSEINIDYLANSALADSESGKGWLWKGRVTQSKCTYTVTTTIKIWDPISGSYILSTGTQTLDGLWKTCDDGWSLCSSGCSG